MDIRKRIEQTVLGHFEYLPQVLGFATIEDQGLHIIHCGLGSSMFNIVFGDLLLPQEEMASAIARIIDRFGGQPFAWWVPPTDRVTDVVPALVSAGCHMETTEHAMVCDLEALSADALRTTSGICQVRTRAELQDFIAILEVYDPTARSFYERLSLLQLAGREKLFVGYAEEEPTVIGILFEGDMAAGIFGILTREDVRGKGFGTDMMRTLLRSAKERGFRHAILSASSDSGYRIYERLGFVAVGTFACLEYKGRAFV